jgi:hypothetical protein
MRPLMMASRRSPISVRAHRDHWPTAGQPSTRRSSAARRPRSPSAWETTAIVGFRFNRLALFRASLFHTAAPAGFGATDEDARLVQFFFFREVMR